MALPPTRTPTESGAGLAVVDYRSAAKISDPADVDGLISVEFDPVAPGLIWLIQRITIMCTSTTSTRAMVYAGDPTPTNLVDGTDRGNLDVADELSPILLESCTPLTVQWTGASAGAQGVVRVQYQIVQRG